MGFIISSTATYPAIAYREALMNAFSHADYRIAGPVLVKLYRDKMVISNNGGFIAGITPENILHHQPASRNPLLVEALTRLRLVNRSNLGVGRMFSAFLIERKRPPVIQEIGESIAVTFHQSAINPAFRSLVANVAGLPLNVDELLVLLYLCAHPMTTVHEIAENCMSETKQVHVALDGLSRRGLVEPMGMPGQASWHLSTSVKMKLVDLQAGMEPKEWVLRLLQANPEQGVAIATVIKEAGMSRSSAKRLLEKMRDEGLARMVGKGAAVRWLYGQ
ncbi:ATP-binding protein [Nitrosomonas communis]|uniref:ATP-dependent DNA helicase RecG n=1 Tax=Nitrosomonas communis TaxID=44574 RepID=A0A1H2T128_9PROT|nr:ATP-binding protein [Nitrosomonas communis]SDW36999.1 ATP-dependent DNA helicase RecG [Nitrosomonas communis]